MKLLKTIILTTCILSFSVTTINAAEIDCNNPKGFHQKMVCKMGGKGTKEDKNKVPGSVTSFFQKIKNFGGKNIGEEG
jgi:hypothetical protein